MTYTTKPITTLQAERRVERADRSTLGMLVIALALTCADVLDFDGADSMRRREASRMERAWGRMRERWEAMALAHAAVGRTALQGIAQRKAAAAAAKAEDWRRFGANLHSS